MRWLRWGSARWHVLLKGGFALTAVCFTLTWLLPDLRRHWAALFACCLAGAAVGRACSICGTAAYRRLYRELLNLLQVQRHDFLNHLQVLGGLAQLNKPDRALAYIASASQDLERERLLLKCLPPEVALVLLDWFHRLRCFEVPVQVDLSTDFSSCLGSKKVADLIGELMDLAVGHEPKAKEIWIRGFAEGNQQVLELAVVPDRERSGTELLREVRRLARRLAAGVCVTSDKGTFFLRISMTPLAAAAPLARAVRS